MIKKIFVCLTFLCGSLVGFADTRWSITPDGGISCSGSKFVGHKDHIEMSGKRVSVVLRYGIDARGSFSVEKGMVWPMLRTVPNNTHASLMKRVGWDMIDNLVVNNRKLANEKVEKISLRGMLTVESLFEGNIKVVRTYFPSTEQPAMIERMVVSNMGTTDTKVYMPYTDNIMLTDPKKGVSGSYAIRMRVSNPLSLNLAPGKSIEFCGTISAAVEGEKMLDVDCEKEYSARKAFVDALDDNLTLVCPDTVLNRMFAFSKIRACESIYETAGGPMHGPGGESYYAAIWANDQAEYINPYFPFTGYDYGNKSSLNSYLMFARFMNSEGKPIPSSIIAEGKDIWNGAGDRGDAAMIAYGAARYALARGNADEARQLWPLIKWCLDYCKSKINAQGVVNSDSDELEGRFPSGKANLCTSSLYYDALVSVSYLAPLMGEPADAKVYSAQAKRLRKNINTYFAGPVEGFDTYAYYKGNDVLRSWICIPLVMGIDEKAPATLDALFSPLLWTENGMLTQSHTETFWDRTTLYALRGAFCVGATEKAIEFLHRYSTTRLLGDHVPYAIEAWPEGSQRHLSAESGLYGRIITEGLFGIRPTGFNSFVITPRLPKNWNKMELNHIRAFEADFNVCVERRGKKIAVVVSQQSGDQTFLISEGKSVSVVLKP